MRLIDLLGVMKEGQHITIHTLRDDYRYMRVYQLRWHYKYLLDLEVMHIFSEDDEVHAYLKQEGDNMEFVTVIRDELGTVVRNCSDMTEGEIEIVLENHPEWYLSSMEV